MGIRGRRSLRGLHSETSVGSWGFGAKPNSAQSRSRKPSSPRIRHSSTGRNQGHERDDGVLRSVRKRTGKIPRGRGRKAEHKEKNVTPYHGQSGLRNPSLPARISVTGATPPWGGRPYDPRDVKQQGGPGRSSREKGGSLPSPHPPPVRVREHGPGGRNPKERRTIRDTEIVNCS